jgi:hypothetical protein
VNRTLLTGEGGSVVLPAMPLLDRADGGNLIVNPPRAVWERALLTRDELIAWSFLVAATGAAMLEALPQLAGGCVNYWEAGNWSLNPAAPPPGPKTAPVSRQVHMHLFGRGPRALDPAWRWGEAPRFPDFADREAWAAGYAPLTDAECTAIVARVVDILRRRYAVDPATLSAPA